MNNIEEIKAFTEKTAELKESELAHAAGGFSVPESKFNIGQGVIARNYDDNLIKGTITDAVISSIKPIWTYYISDDSGNVIAVLPEDRIVGYSLK